MTKLIGISLNMSRLENGLVLRGGNGVLVTSLSPFLFTLVVVSLSQNIFKAESQNLFKGFQVGFEKVYVSHLQCADDTLILMDGDPRLDHILKLLIQCFELLSSLKVNWSNGLTKSSNCSVSFFLLTICTIGSCRKEQLAAVKYVSRYAVGD